MPEPIKPAEGSPAPAPAPAPAAPAAPNDPPKAPVPGTPEYDAAMAAKFDKASTPSGEVPAPAPDARPAWLPEKFKSAEDLAKAYAELEKKASGAPATPPPAVPPKAGDPTPPAPSGEPPAGVPKALFETATAEFVEKGELSPETYAGLEKSGIDKATVDAYIEGRRAIAAQYDAAGYEAAGGKEQYAAMIAWAGNNLSEAEIAAYDAVVASGNTESMKLAVQGLALRYTGANPTLIGGRGGASEAGYASLAEMKADMSDPKYAKDPAFRAMVERKIASSRAI